MKYKTREKPTSTVKDLLNWSEVSKLLTNGSDNIRKERIPKVHNTKINELIMLLELWKSGKKVFTEDEIIKVIGNIDLKPIIVGKLGLPV